MNLTRKSIPQFYEPGGFWTAACKPIYAQPLIAAAAAAAGGLVVLAAYWLTGLLPLLTLQSAALAAGLPAAAAGSAVYFCAARARNHFSRLLDRIAYQELLMEIHHEGLIAVDMQGSVIHWNQGAETIYGYAAGEVLGKPLNQFISIDLDGPIEERMRQILEVGQWRGEFVSQRKDGRRVWIEAAVTVLRDRQGQPSALVGIDRDITDKKNAEIALEEAEQRYRSMFSESRAVMLLIDPQTGQLLDANQSAVNFYGYARQQLLSMKITQINTLPPEKVHERMQRAQSQSQTYFDFRHRLADGSSRDVEVYSSPVVVGRKTALYSIIHDVTERQKAQAALMESERRLREMMENVRLAAVTINCEQEVTFCNEFLARITGWSQEEIIGQKWGERFVPAEEREVRATVLDRLMQGNRISYHLERNVLTRDGGQRIIAWDLFPLHAEGQVIGMAGIGEDVTELRRAEQAVQRRAQEIEALQKTGRTLTSAQDQGEVLAGIASAARVLLNSDSAAILLHDPERGQLEYAAIDGQSPARECSLGTRICEREGVAGWVLQRGQPVLREDLKQAPDDAPLAVIAVPLLYGQSVLGVLQIESRAYVAYAEHQRVILATLADLAAVSVVTHRLIGVEREQRAMLERTHNQLIQSEKLNAMGQLVAFLAHEINNPIQSLRGGLDLLQNAPLSDEKRREYLELSSREVDRLSGIVSRVLGFYRRPPDTQKEVNLHHVLDETLKLVEKRIERGRIQISRQYNPNLPCVEGYYDQLHQVILNLILNGAAAMPRGGVLTIHTDWDEREKKVLLTIKDTGEGISPEALPHIFEPFYTSRPNGLGMGLPISKSIIQKHQGRIDVKSEPGAGTAFTIVLPTELDKSQKGTGELN
jgi:PAS domain S-box-containing protein